MISLKCCVWNMILRALKSYFKFQNPQILKWRSDPHPLNLGALTSFCEIKKKHEFWSDRTTSTTHFEDYQVLFQVRKPANFEVFQQLLPPHFDSWSCSSSYKTKQISDSKFKIWRFLAPFGIWMDSMYSQFQIILKFSFRWKSNSSSKTFKNIKNNFLAQFDRRKPPP